jgi:hypothetical protein
MVTSQNCLNKYGPPSESNPNLVLWNVPRELQVSVVPKRIYINKDMIEPLTQAIKNLIERKFISELKTWDGCFNIRKKRGLTSWSLHSWAVAVDLNAFENGLNMKPQLSLGFVKCFTDAGFDWGGLWHTRVDGMHFQLSKI